MKKILLPTLLLTTAIPAVSITACSQPVEPEPEPEPDYIEVKLSVSPDFGKHRSGKINLEKGKSYKFVIETIDSSEDNFLFSDMHCEQDYYVSAEVDKILVNDKESTGYYVSTHSGWTITNWKHGSGKAEVYISVSETKNNVYAWTLG